MLTTYDVDLLIVYWWIDRQQFYRLINIDINDSDSLWRNFNTVDLNFNRNQNKRESIEDLSALMSPWHCLEQINFPSSDSDNQ